MLLKNTPIDFPADKFESHVCAPYSFLELTQILAGLKDRKSTGYDMIPNELLKHSSFKYRQYLLIFLNKIISDGVVPEQLNSGKCILIHKVYINNLKNISLTKYIQGGDSLSMGQYRPITVPSNILRLLTVRMTNIMTSIAEENKMFGGEQFGFRTGRSTIDAAFVLSTLIKKAKAKH